MAEPKNDEQVENLSIDTVNLFEIDKSVYNWLNRTKSLKINGRQVPVLFGSWERFAQMQGAREDDNLNALRDTKGMLKLPIISIRRGDVTPSDERYVSTNMDGEPSIVFQEDIAKSRFDNKRVQFNPKWKLDTSQYATSEPVKQVYRLPFPTFLNIPYTLTFWASYVKHANNFHRKMWDEFRPSDINYNGYFFYGNIDGSSDESNMDDFSTDERIIRHSFNLNLEGYIIDRDNIKVDRSVSRFVFEEKTISLDDQEMEKEIFTF
jgi:hypothetical protein